MLTRAQSAQTWAEASYWMERAEKAIKSAVVTHLENVVMELEADGRAKKGLAA